LGAAPCFIAPPHLSRYRIPILQLLFLTILTQSCIHIEPVNSVEKAHQVSQKKGVLVELDPVTLKKLHDGKLTLERPLIVEYTADWCTVCRRIKPEMARPAEHEKLAH
jgi:thiol:disulfide interchange protein